MDKDLSAEGLRGVAALSVFFAHFLLCFFPAGFTIYFPGVAMPDAFHGAIENAIATPLVSALWNGRFAVNIFFVLSGYVLTKGYRRTGRIESIRSLAFRRYLRLGIPVFCSVMLAWAVYRLGLFHIGDTVALTKSQWLTERDIHHGSLWAALRDGLYGVILLGHDDYNTVFWTMRIEFIGSLLIFAYVLIAYPDRRAWLVAIAYMTLTFLLAPTIWPFYWAFLIGCHLDDLRVPLSRWMLWALLAAAFYLASVNQLPLYRPLQTVTLEEPAWSALWSTLAGALVVLSVRRGLGHQFLTSRPVQFLGRVSYPLYLTHAPIILSVGCGTYVALHGHYGMGRAVASIAALAVSLPLTLVISAYFERWIDQPTIALGKWLVNRPSCSSSAVMDVKTG